jgi:hypothetical protein
MRHAAARADLRNALDTDLCVGSHIARARRGASRSDPAAPPDPAGQACRGTYTAGQRGLSVEHRRIAIFDAQPVRAGDTVGAYRIDEVDALGVRYSVSGHSEFAPLATTAPLATAAGHRERRRSPTATAAHPESPPVPAAPQ